MNTDDRRIYGSAQQLIALYRLRPRRITGTGKEGAITKGDVEAYLAGEQERVPSQHPMTLYLAVQGLDNEEMAERVRETHDGSGMQPSHVTLSISKERRRAEGDFGSPWWEDQGVQKALAEHRPQLKGVGEALEIKPAASSQPSEG